MKKSHLFFAVAITFMSLVCSCGSGVEDDVKIDSKPLNVSILLDLSDRLIQDTDGMTQVEKDTAIVGDIRDYILKDVTNKQILNADARLKIYFYPSPNIDGINTLANALEYDFGACTNLPDKKPLALKLRDEFIPSLAAIYDKTLETKKWTGSDIYGFMQNKAQSYCVKKGYRNILIILSDGFIYDVNNWGKEGKRFKGITPKSLQAGQEGIIPTGVSIPDLEVLFLEVNAPQTHHAEKVKSMISEWLSAMSITHAEVISTDLPSNTRIIINNFFAE